MMEVHMPRKIILILKWIPGSMILMSLIISRKVIVILKWILNCMIVMSHNIQCWWFHQWILVIPKHSGTSLYNMVNYNTIWIYHDIDNCWICITLWTEKGNPLLHYSGWTMVYLLRVFMGKTLCYNGDWLYHHIKRSQCSFSHGDPIVNNWQQWKYRRGKHVDWMLVRETETT